MGSLRRPVRASLLGVVLLGVGLAAKEPLLECGSYVTTAQEQAFLHLTHTLQRVRARVQASQSATEIGAPTAAIAKDIGDIAVMDGGNGIVGQRNPFNLSLHTVRFGPVTGGYVVQAFDNSIAGSTTSYDETAALAGTPLPLADDDTKRIALPFAFNFYGSTYREAFVNSNGTVTFTQGNFNDNLTFGGFAAGLPMIAGFATDLNPASSDGVRVLTEDGRVVVSWTNVPSSVGSPGSSNTFQIRMYAGGRIELAYGAASADYAVVGITPGSLQPVTLVDLLSQPTGWFAGGVAEVFSSTTSVDMQAVAQRFYQTHDDAYDYLVVYNAMGVNAGPGVVAYELTTRSKGEGYGDTPVDEGATYGSAKRLQAVLNVGPLTQYPSDPYAAVPSRGSTGDTSMSILGHESGHLFLALVSVPPPANSVSPPMLGAGLAHWAFTFNSDASFLEGNRIADGGANSSPRFHTTDTVQHYSDVDQYLMGFLPPEQVPSTFAVLNSGQSNSRAPQVGVGFGGSRLGISIGDIIQAAGRRTPDSTVAQKEFRFAFIVIVPEGADLTAGSAAALAVQQAERYRAEFPAFYGKAAGYRATITTSLKRDVSFSMWPAAGLVTGRSHTATLRVAAPVASPVSFVMQKDGTALTMPDHVTIPTGQREVAFNFQANSGRSVSKVTFTPDNASFHDVTARIQVRDPFELHFEIASITPAPIAGVQTVALRVVDINRLPYPDVEVAVIPSAGGKVDKDVAVTDDAGIATFLWTPSPTGSFDTLMASLQTASEVQVAVSSRGLPVVFSSGGVLNSASFTPALAPGSLASVFGASLANGTSAAAVGVQFPTILSNVRVRVNGVAAPLLYVSDAQLNFMIPPTTPVGAAQLVVETAAGRSAPATIQISTVAPAIFVNSGVGAEDPRLQGYGAVLFAGTSLPTYARQSKTGDYWEVYCTGLGRDPKVTAKIGGANLLVTYAGDTVLPGLNQVNLKLPSGIPTGEQGLVLTVNGVPSNTVKVRVGDPSSF